MSTRELGASQRYRGNLQPRVWFEFIQESEANATDPATFQEKITLVRPRYMAHCVEYCTPQRRYEFPTDIWDNDTSIK